MYWEWIFFFLIFFWHIDMQWWWMASHREEELLSRSNSWWMLEWEFSGSGGGLNFPCYYKKVYSQQPWLQLICFSKKNSSETTGTEIFKTHWFSDKRYSLQLFLHLNILPKPFHLSLNTMFALENLKFSSKILYVLKKIHAFYREKKKKKSFSPVSAWQLDVVQLILS